MKIKYTIIFLLMLQFFANAQLFPKLNDIVGKVESVTEKKYGKEINFLNLKKGVYWKNAFSGWKFEYEYDTLSRINRRTITFEGKLQTEYTYQYDTIENRIVSREIISFDKDGKVGNYVELDSYFDNKGRIERVNFSFFDAIKCTKELFLIEHSPVYDGSKLISFIRNQINESGDTIGNEKCIIEYNNQQKPVQITRIDIESGFSTKIYYTYNPDNYLSHYSIDFMSEIQEYKKIQIQDVFFEYDNEGNWIKMYAKSGEKSKPEAKRKLKYYKE